ncbi:hypothetical protein IFM89_003101 [Coptis chinensis]|uniref:Metallo-beta-lactamase domain-containing protein n=1 Tax=Coptis chinensis TaxID=261450 RepID=A0A835M8R6_9MAGN|nr:hypothetical protein IFM89_003101 [Coptis chinensis]
MEKPTNSSSSSSKNKKVLEIEGYPIEGLSIGGQETCVIFPTLKLAFDIGRCPQRAISQDFLFITHAHMDHIGGLPMYVATRGLYKMEPPTVIVPVCIKENVEKLLQVHRSMDQSELKVKLIGLDIGEEFELRKGIKVRAFRTYHTIPSQFWYRDAFSASSLLKFLVLNLFSEVVSFALVHYGAFEWSWTPGSLGYIVYSMKQKLKQEYVGFPGNEIKNLKLSGVEITDTVTVPEIAFTGDTTSDFIVDIKQCRCSKCKNSHSRGIPSLKFSCSVLLLLMLFN